MACRRGPGDFTQNSTPTIRRNEANLAAPARRLDDDALTDFKGRLLGLGL